MKEYVAYRSWWVQHEAPHKVPSSYWGINTDEAFEQHIKNLGLYELMEILSQDWIAEL